MYESSVITAPADILWRDADMVLQQVKLYFESWIEENDSFPDLISDWDSVTQYAIVWEDGPSDWAYEFDDYAEERGVIPNILYVFPIEEWVLGIYPI